MTENRKMSDIVNHGRTYKPVSELAQVRVTEGHKPAAIAEELTFALVILCLTHGIDLEVAHRVIRDVQRVSQRALATESLMRAGKMVEA